MSTDKALLSPLLSTLFTSYPSLQAVPSLLLSLHLFLEKHCPIPHPNLTQKNKAAALATDTTFSHDMLPNSEWVEIPPPEALLDSTCPLAEYAFAADGTCRWCFGDEGKGEGTWRIDGGADTGGVAESTW